MTFGEIVASLMEERGYSQQELARRCSLPAPHINMIVNNKVKRPTIETAFVIADALGVDVNVFRECFVEGERECIKDDSTA